ncbi:MAG TPA: DUF6614 family protein [Candidatus Binataceae bacterium]|nr:DUF6614 family protein [Candidatus Binataceae bacterium]
MNVYHAWFNLKDGVSDVEFADAAREYLELLKSEGYIAAYRITRCKFGLGHPNLPEWNIMLEFESMAQMDRAFDRVAARTNPVEGFHHEVNSRVKDIFFALYRDFPDPVRQRGEEQF